jgi:hypothetical protein
MLRYVLAFSLIFQSLAGAMGVDKNLILQANTPVHLRHLALTYPTIKSAEQFDKTYLKNLKPKDRDWALKMLGTLSDLPKLKVYNWGFVLDVEGKKVETDVRRAHEKIFTINKIKVVYDPSSSLQTQSEILGKKLADSLEVRNPLFELLFPRAEAVIQWAVVGAFALVFAGNYWGNTVAKVVDYSGCWISTDLIKGKELMKRMNLCEAYIKAGEEQLHGQYEISIPNGDTPVPPNYDQLFYFISEVCNDPIKNGITTIAIWVKEKEVLTIKTIFKGDGTVDKVQSFNKEGDVLGTYGISDKSIARVEAANPNYDPNDKDKKKGAQYIPLEPGKKDTYSPEQVALLEKHLKIFEYAKVRMGACKGDMVQKESAKVLESQQNTPFIKDLKKAK